MSILRWIDDSNLFKAVEHLLNKAKEAQEQSVKKFGKNIIDPFAAMFEISGFELDYKAWEKSETTRQAQKTLQNHIGEFHQIILGSVDGWENMKTGHVIDLVSDKNKVIAEIKNKFNTVSFGKLSELYHSLDEIVMRKSSIYKDYTAYYVPVIPKNPVRYNKEFTPSDKEKGSKCQLNKNIREIDGASFYSLVTGEPYALENLFDALPNLIYEISGKDYALKNKENLKEFFNTAFK